MKIDRHQGGGQDRGHRTTRPGALARAKEMIAGAQRRLADGGGEARIVLQFEKLLRRQVQRRQQIEWQIELVPVGVKRQRAQQPR